MNFKSIDRRNVSTAWWWQNLTEQVTERTKTARLVLCLQTNAHVDTSELNLSNSSNWNLPIWQLNSNRIHFEEF